MEHRANVRRPYKMYAAMVSMAVTTGLAEWVDAPLWATVVGGMIVSALAVFLTPNPIVES